MRASTDGSYSALPIPLYTFDIDARHPKTSASTSNSVGDFVPPETVVTKNLVFNGTGNLRGSVRRHSGGLVAGALVRLCTDDSVNCQAHNYDTTQANGTYLLSGSNPADYFLFVQKSHPQEGAGGAEPLRGRATTTITAGDTAVADVVLESTGTLSGFVRAANGDPVEDAQVTLYFANGSGWIGARVARTDTAGRYRFFDVRTGGVRVDARDSTSGADGTATGGVNVDEESFVDVTLRGFGAIEVSVAFARGLPTPDAYVYYSGDRGGSLRTDSAGRGSVSLPVGRYTFYAQHPDEAGAGLGATASAEIATNGQVVGVVMTLKPAGAVKGTIVRPDGSTLAGGFPYTVRLINGSSNQVRGGQTSSAGLYRTGGLAPGLYMLTAYDPAFNRFADQEFLLTEDGEEVQLDLRVEDNRIALPANLFDANRFRFDVQQSGALDTGHSWTFDHGGLGLEIDGQAFTGDTSALLEAGKRQFAISQDQPLSGLKVTRKVFVPRGAYFARYLEVLENPTADPITAEAVLTTKYKAAQALTTSSGDALLTTADQWVALDDADPEDVALSDGQQPPTAHVFAQAAAARPTDAVAYTVGGDGRGTLVARWSGLVVPAGGKVVLMHFAVQQVNRAGAIASAERLVQLPPEAIQSLAESEIQSIVNFAVPAGATSALAPLPPLTGSVSGRVFEGDGVTPVVGVRMSVRSAHPLFNRIWGLQRDPIFCTMAGTVVPSLISTSASQQAGAPPAGTYSLAGRLTDTDSVAMPEGVELRVVAQEPLGCFGTYAGHSWTHIPSHEYRLNASGARDVLFDSGILTGTVTGYADYQVTGGRMYLSIEDPDPYVYRYVPLRSDGTYTYPGMAPGTYDVLADTSHPQGSGLRGGRGGALVTLGATTVTDVPLQPAGALQGAVLTANGEASVNARVQIASPAPDQTYDRCDSGCVPETLAKHKGKQAVSRETRTDSLGRYGFTAVPPGRYAMTVTDPISDGRKTLEVTVTENQVAVQNVILLPLGSVALSVRLPSGQPAVDALVYLYADAQGFEETAGRTNAQGRLTVANIPQGNFTIRVRDPRRPANSFFDRRVSGTITTNGEELPLTVTLLASTTLRVTTTDGDNGNAILPGADIYLQDARAGLRFVGTSDAQGVFSVVGVPEGAFVVEARKSLEGTTAVWSFSGTVSLADDAIVRDLAASIRRTAGSVRATVVDRDTANAPIANADVYLTDSTRFRQYRGRTDAAGQLFIPGVAVGSFTVTARATLSGALQEAEATGTVTAANISQTQQVRPELTSTIVPLPRTIYDANQFPYDVQPNGSIAHGRWAYYGAFNAGAAVLELNGVPFTGASQARLEAGTRQLAVTQQVAGLEVTRKVYVPRSGYFARYLEILDNRTGAPVTVEAKVTHRYYNRALVATSSGDAAVQATDEWATLDDSYDGDTFRLYYDEAATAHVHGQAGSAVSLSALRFENDSAGYYGPGKRVVQTWTPVTVPANGRVILMHFVVQQVNRAGSRAAAERLVQLPPEAIDAMTAGERDAVLNFTIPADGQSAVAALPPLTGRVEGRAYEGDQVTPARNAALSIKSRNALFSRTWTTSSGTQGEFALAGQITDSSTSVPIPAGGAVQIDARHGLTQLAAPTYAPSFADDTTVLSQNVVFPSGIIAGRVTGPPDYPIRSGWVYLQAYRNSVAVNGIVYANPDGTYAFPGLQDGTHELRLTAYHDQGSNLTGRLAGIVVTAGATATADVPIEPTGRIAGTVRLSSNVPAGPNHNIRLAGLPGTPASRSTYTNAAGLYALSAVPVGTYTLTVTDARNGATVSSTLEVRAGEALTRDIVLSATGTVQLTVNHARGVPAVSAPVYLTAPSVPGERFMGYTSSSGRLDIPAPAGTFSLRATHPRASYRTAPFDSTLTGTLATDGQVLPATLALKAVADVLVSVKNADAANAPIANAQIYIADGRGSRLYWGNTNASGQILLTGVPEGPYTVSASLSDGRSFGRAGTIGTADDGQTVNTTIAVSYQLDVLGALSFEGERRLYAMPASLGDVLSVSAFGEARDGQPALALTHVFVYDPDKDLVASGYRYAGAGGYQYSEFGDLASIPAQKNGIYTAAVEAYWPAGPSALGAFRLIAQRSGEPTAPVGYPGGSVEGRVLEADGATPAPSQTVALKTLDALALYVRVIADATGQYRFDGVPLAEYRVAAVDPDVNAEVVRATGTLAAAGVTTAPDLVLPAKSIFTIQVEDGVGNPYGAGVSVEVTDAAPKRTLYTDGAGEVVTVGFGQLTATATYDGLGGSATASAVDGQPVTLVVRLVASSLSGYVLDTAGAPRADRSVYLYRDWWWYLGSAVTSADGSFIFSDVPAGVPLRLVTYDPTLDRDVTLEVTVPPGQQLGNQVLRLATVGSVRGRVQLADGTGLPYRDVLAHYDRGGEGEIGRYASTDESGEYLFDANLPVGKLIRLTSYNYTFNTQAEASVSIAGAGQTAIAPPLVFPGGTLRIRVEDADGTPVLGSFAVYFDRSYLSYSDGTEQLVPGVPPGNHRLELFDYWIWAYVAALDVVVEDGPTTDAPLVVSAVKGQVRHTNGDPVVNGTVYLVTAAGVSYYSGLDADGRYAVHGVAPGDFTVSASDSDSGLFAEVAGSLAGAGTAETLDVALPASGTVTGVFRDGNGSPVPGATVFIRSSGLEYDRYVTTDATGTYLAPHVALGTLTIQAQDPVTSLVAEATGLLDTDQGTVVVDLLSPQGGALTGLLLEIDAVTPVPGALVTLQSVRQQGNFGTYYNAVTTDADGRYLFSPAPAASLLVGAQHPSDPQQAAAATVTVTAGTTVEQTLVMGTGVRFDYNLDGQDGFRYDVGCEGALGDGGTADRSLQDAYNGAYNLVVNGQSFSCSTVGLSLQAGREVRMGPTSFGSLLVSRRIFVPAAGGYVRFLDEVTNDSAAEVTVPIEISSTLGSWFDTRVLVAPSTVESRYAVTADSLSAPNDPPLAHVLGDGDSASLAPASTSFQDGSPWVNARWELTIPAGETRSIMTFGVQRRRDGVAAAQAQAESLSGKAEAGMLAGLSPEDRARVRNFTLP